MKRVIGVPIFQHIRQVLFQCQVGGMKNFDRQAMLRREAFQGLEQALLLVGPIREDNFQADRLRVAPRDAGYTFSTICALKPVVSSTSSTSGDGRVTSKTRLLFFIWRQYWSNARNPA